MAQAGAVALLMLVGVLAWGWFCVPSYAFPTPADDFTDDRVLVDWAAHVFVGKVLARTGATSSAGLIETRFSVQVLEDIKGSLPDEISISQLGGSFWGHKLIVAGDRLVEPGQTYLMATRSRSAASPHHLASPYGSLPIDNASEYRQVVDRFRSALAEQPR